MAYEENTDHEGDALARLTSQFQEKVNITALIHGLVGAIQTVEGQLNSLYSERWVDTAVGDQLDIIGFIVGELRAGRNDVDYRNAIIARIAINTSFGTPENMIAIFSLLTGSDNVQILEYYPGVVELFCDVDFSAQNVAQFYDIMDIVAPAGVRIGYLGTFAVDEGEFPFGFFGDTNVLGFSSVDDPTVGGQFAKVITA